MSVFLSLEKINKSFGRKKVLSDLSLELHKGEIIGLVGRSGCGKSTLIKILVGYHKPDSGRVILEGEDITDDFSKVRSIAGYTTQENSFYEKLTVNENMKYYAHLYNVKDKKKRIAELLSAVDLEQAKDVLAESISGGMKRRLDFAISMIHHPKLVILDEPTTGLDPVLVENFWQIVTSISEKQGITVLVSSHLLDEIKAHCTKAAVMAEGSIKKVINITPKTDIESEFKKLTA
jgi:ABC-2 type transport system ATP-binding protein